MQRRTSAASSRVKIENCEVALNKAFDGLNVGALMIKATPSELGDILTEVLHSNVEIYKRAHQLYMTGDYVKSRRQAEVVCEMSQLIINLAEEKAYNNLDIPEPPGLYSFKDVKPKPMRAIHPALNLLEAVIRRRMTSGSKYYKARLQNYDQTLVKVSKQLNEIGLSH